MTGRHRVATILKKTKILIGVAVLGLGYLGGSLVSARVGQDTAETKTQHVRTQRDTIRGEAQQFAQQVQQACDQKTVTGPICAQATDLAKVPPMPDAAPVPAGLTAAQVQAQINTALARQQAAQPSQLAAAVQAFIAANPAMFKAPAPTAEQVQTAVNNYMRTHPIQTAQPIYPQYDMPGLGGFSGAPGGVWPQPWPRGGPRAPR